jgi:predicted phage-related endonuclease
MKTHDLIQGSAEWLSYRATMRNASDAPAMMGCSPYKTRAELLREAHTGMAGAVDIATQKRFDNGHRAEALARPLAEQIIGQDLYPVTGSSGKLSASFDGLTLDGNEGFEHKALNAEIQASFGAMDRMGPHDDAAACRLLPLHHRVQMEQQLHVSGAERILFMASEWDASGELVRQRHCWYYPDDELRGAILAGWAQFERDLDTYVLPEAADPAPVGRAPESLPALRIEVTGEVTASNLAEFKETALAAIRSVNRELKTDADFADAAKAVKWCEDVESRLRQAKEHALSQTATIDALFKTLDDIGAEAKAVRLDLGKLVDRRRVEVKEQAVVAARRALDVHVATLNDELSPMRLQPVAADFAGAIKGLRSIASMQDALDTTLAGAKIAADAQARVIRGNVATFKAQAAGLEFLFADLGAVVHKAADDFAALVSSRIATHQAAEAERERKRKADEEARIQAEAQRLAAQQIEDTRVAALAEQRRQDAAAESVRVAQQAAAQPVAAPTPAPAAPAPVARPVAPAQATRIDEPATLDLGTICGRLGFTVSAQFLADVLHIQPARTDKASKLYTETQFAAICREIISHVGAMAELYAGEPA